MQGFSAIFSKYYKNTKHNFVKQFYKGQVIHRSVLYPVLYEEYIIGRPRKGEQESPEFCLEKLPNKTLEDPLKEIFQNQMSITSLGEILEHSKNVHNNTHP